MNKILEKLLRFKKDAKKTADISFFLMKGLNTSEAREALIITRKIHQCLEDHERKKHCKARYLTLSSSYFRLRDLFVIEPDTCLPFRKGVYVCGMLYSLIESNAVRISRKAIRKGNTLEQINYIDYGDVLTTNSRYN